MEKVKKYKKTKTTDSSSSSIVEDKNEFQVFMVKRSGDAIGESSGGEYSEEKMSKKGVSRIPSIDFVGLSFSDKKQTRGLPAGLVPVVDSYSDGDLSEVEFIAGDGSKFAPPTELKPELTEEEHSDQKVIQPGGIHEHQEIKLQKMHVLKTNFKPEEYGGQIVDPKLKSESEKTLKEGDTLMDRGNLQQALPYFEKVMKDMAFQSELHGRAALKWSICQDSEKLQCHPTVEVRKKAKQLNFGFEMMKKKIMLCSDKLFHTSYFFFAPILILFLLALRKAVSL
ncbi:hypothetical protein MKW92_051311 [Papaver armeniacum]|nr:hypothetical protein MKW92_051311 [Papaver armeniacum]